MTFQPQDLPRSLPLPPNSSLLERCLAKAMALPDDLVNIGDTLQERFAYPSDEELPFLIWEWGLQPVLPYLSNPRRALDDGRKWQKTRGTIPAGHTARSWIGVTATHEQQQDKRFHLHLDQLKAGSDLDAVIILSRLSHSLRSKLFRITYKLDHRELKGGISHYGQALHATMSGINFRDDWPMLSLREFDVAHVAATNKVHLSDSISIKLAALKQIDIRYAITKSPAKQTLAGHDANRASQSVAIEFGITTYSHTNLNDAPLSDLPLSDELIGISLIAHMEFKEV